MEKNKGIKMNTYCYGRKYRKKQKNKKFTLNKLYVFMNKLSNKYKQV